MLSYILWVEALLTQASCFSLCQMECVFKARINPQFHRPGNLKGVAAFKILTQLYPYKCVNKVQPHQPSVLIVFPSQMLKYIPFLKEYGVCGNNKESTS